MMLRFDIGGTVSIPRCLNVRRSSLSETTRPAGNRRAECGAARGADSGDDAQAADAGSGVATASGSPTSGTGGIRDATQAETRVIAESSASTTPGCHHA